jgi:hypothetical protein
VVLEHPFLKVHMERVRVPDGRTVENWPISEWITAQSKCFEARLPESVSFRAAEFIPGSTISARFRTK